MKRAFPIPARHRAVAVGLVAQALQYGSVLLLLPFVVTRLPGREADVWYIFVTIQGLAALADFGFQPTLARSFAAAFAGAPELRRQGIARGIAGGTGAGTAPNLPLAAAALSAARRLYAGLAAAVLVVLLTGGLAYVTSVVTGEVASVAAVQIAWAVFALGVALNLYFAWVSPLLLGAERISQNYLTLIANRGSFAVIGLLALLAGGGLLGLALATVAAALIGRLVAVRFLRPVAGPLTPLAPSAAARREVLAAIWPNASRMGVVALGAFLILRLNVPILERFEGLATAGSYAVSLQLLVVVTIVAQLPMQIALPQMVAARVRGDRAAVWRLFRARTAFFLLAATAGVLGIALLGPVLLDLIGSRIALLPTPLLLLLGLVLILEGNHANAAFVITTGNQVPFAATSVISGVAVTALAILAAWRGLGVLGVVLAQGGVQLAYANWRWPLMLWRDLRPSPALAERRA